MPEYVNELVPLERDLSVFAKLELAKPPVGVDFLFAEPQGLLRLDKKLGLCEMVTEAQEGKAFYAGLEDHECAGPVPLGMMGLDPFYHSGRRSLPGGVQGGTGQPKDLRSVAHAQEGHVQLHGLRPSRQAHLQPRRVGGFRQGAADGDRPPLHELDHGPDVREQGTPVMGCAWTLVYPYLSGKINFSVTGHTFGHIAREVARKGTSPCPCLGIAFPRWWETCRR